jgi:hypothetical protein
MHGSSIGHLKVNVLSGVGFTNTETVLTISGEQHSSSDISHWEEAFIDISQYEGQVVKIEFEGMKMTDGFGDIAIDLVQVCSENFIFTVPTLSQWGAICLGMLIMIFGAVTIRMRSVVSLN